MPAKLPDQHIEHDHIYDMTIGQTRYAVPWAMAVDEAGECWLNGDYTTHDVPGGTVDMRIYRMANGYAVLLCDWFKYEERPLSSAGNWLPVAIIER